MRLHTDTLTASDIYAATTAQGMRGVHVELTSHGSRSRDHAFDVHLTGTSSRRPNNGRGGRFRDDLDGGPYDHAATWDEWGMFLAALFARDPYMLAGSAYVGAAHYATVTGGHFLAGNWRDGWDLVLTAPLQHGGGGHRWQFAGAAREFECASCGALRSHFPASAYLHDLEARRRERVAA